MEYKRRTYVQKLIDRQNNGLIKVITGARRSGKSYLMNELYYRHLIESGVEESHIIRFAFDADEDLDLLDDYMPTQNTILEQGTVNAKKFRAFIKERTQEEGQYFLLLDEIQILDRFVGTLNSFLKHKNFDVYVTGSNSRLLSSDIATEFKGRGTIIHVYPLTFKEYIEGFHGHIQAAWREYIVTGGIPLVAEMNGTEEKMDYLKLLCQETYLKDIIAHNHVKKKTELADIFDLLASMIGTLVNPHNIGNTFKSVLKKDLADQTIDQYIHYFKDAFLIDIAKKYNIKGRKYIGSPYKIYFEDIGVRNARLNFRQIEETHIMENIIYNELRYRGFNVDVGEVNINEATERRDKNGKKIYVHKSLEVDFIVTKGDEKYYIQSALSLGDQAKSQQEKKSLYFIDDSFKKIVITKNGLNPMYDDQGILTIDLFDFLLGEHIL